MQSEALINNLSDDSNIIDIDHKIDINSNKVNKSKKIKSVKRKTWSKTVKSKILVRLKNYDFSTKLKTIEIYKLNFFMAKTRLEFTKLK